MTANVPFLRLGTTLHLSLESMIPSLSQCPRTWEPQCGSPLHFALLRCVERRHNSNRWLESKPVLLQNRARKSSAEESLLVSFRMWCDVTSFRSEEEETDVRSGTFIWIPTLPATRPGRKSDREKKRGGLPALLL